MQFQWQFADLVKEQRAVRGVFKISRLDAAGTGEGTFGIAKKGGFHECRCDRCAIQREIRFGSALRQQVKVVGDDFLAAARLTFDEHRERRVGELSDLRAQFLYWQAFANQAICRRLQFAPCFGVGEVQRSEQQTFDRCRIGGFGDKFCCSQCSGVSRVGFIILPGQNKNFHRWRMGEQIGDQRETFVRAVWQRRQSEINQRKRCRL